MSPFSYRGIIWYFRKKEGISFNKLNFLFALKIKLRLFLDMDCIFCGSLNRKGAAKYYTKMIW